MIAALALFPLHAIKPDGAAMNARSGDVGHTLTAVPPLPELSLPLRRKPCPSIPLHTHTCSSCKIRRCCVDRLNPPPKSGHSQLFHDTIAVAQALLMGTYYHCVTVTRREREKGDRRRAKVQDSPLKLA